jgi:hypothetical protein
MGGQGGEREGNNDGCIRHSCSHLAAVQKWKVFNHVRPCLTCLVCCSVCWKLEYLEHMFGMLAMFGEVFQHFKHMSNTLFDMFGQVQPGSTCLNICLVMFNKFGVLFNVFGVLFSVFKHMFEVFQHT